MSGGRGNDAMAAMRTRLLHGKVITLESEMLTKEPIIAKGAPTQFWDWEKKWVSITSSMVAEDTNLYFTDARAIAANSSAIALKQNAISAGSTNQVYAWDRTFKDMTNAMHQNLGGGALHAVATQSVNGFMAATDKVKVDTLTTNFTNIARGQGLVDFGLIGVGQASTAITITGIPSTASVSVDIGVVSGGQVLGNLIALRVDPFWVITTNTLTVTMAARSLVATGKYGFSYIAMW